MAMDARDYEGIVRLLLEKKADVHIVNVGGGTPPHTAAAFRADPFCLTLGSGCAACHSH